MKYLVFILTLSLSGCDSFIESAEQAKACRNAPWEYDLGDLVKFKPTGETVRIIHRWNYCHYSKDRRREYSILFPGDLSLMVRPEKLEPL